MESKVITSEDWWKVWKNAEDLVAKAQTYPLPIQKEILAMFMPVKFHKKNANINWRDCAIKPLFFAICRRMKIDDDRMFTCYAFWSRDKMLELIA